MHTLQTFFWEIPCQRWPYFFRLEEGHGEIFDFARLKAYEKAFLLQLIIKSKKKLIGLLEL